MPRKAEAQVNLEHPRIIMHFLRACGETDAPEVLLFSEYINASHKAYWLVLSPHIIKIYGVNEWMSMVLLMTYTSFSLACGDKLSMQPT